MFTAAFLGNRTLQSAIGMQSPYILLHLKQPNLRFLESSVPGPSWTTRRSQNLLNLRGWTTSGVQQQQQELPSVQSGHPAHYGERNVIFIETPTRLFSPLLEECSQHIIVQSNGMDEHTSQTKTFWAIFAFTLQSWNLPCGSADHITVGGLSDNMPVAERLEQISQIMDGGAT